MKGSAAWVAVLFILVGLSACSNDKQSSVEGKLVDWENKPVAGVKITATQVQPINGYEQFEAETNSDGTFKLGGLFPTWVYVLKPWSDKWNCKTKAQVESWPRGKTAVLSEALRINAAYAKNGCLVVDLATGSCREVSSEGVIFDPKTGLEWVEGPNQDSTYSESEKWVAACQVAGGGWRMPTEQELKGLYRLGIGERNMDVVFQTTGWIVAAESPDSSLGRGFNFKSGTFFSWDNLHFSKDLRMFGVRLRR